MTWLQEYLHGAVEAGLCMKVGCTTCGARDFRLGMIRGLSNEPTTVRDFRRFDRQVAISLADELGRLDPDIEDRRRFEDGVRLILCDLWGQGHLSPDIESRFSGHWPHRVLQSMRAHDEARRRRQTELERMEVDAARLREERQRERAVRHAERLEAKKERDRLWRSQHPSAAPARHRQEISISSRDFWFKIVGMLQHNWALIDEKSEGVVVWFVDDLGGVFDRLQFPTLHAAETGLRRNGFTRFAEDPKAEEIIGPPSAPFRPREHPNGPIYSSERFWRRPSS